MNDFASKYSFKNESIVIENNGSSVWAYLVDEEKGGIQKDVFVCSPIPPEKTLDKEHIRSGGAPKLTKEWASDSAFMPEVAQSQYSVVSSDNGDYCILIDGDPVASIFRDHERGYSKALMKEGGFGNPWSQAVYESVFN